MSDIFYAVYNKYCPNCQKRNKKTDKYCPVCHWWLGNVPAVRENLYDNIKDDLREMEAEKRMKELQNAKPASAHLVNRRMNYKYTTDAYNNDIFWEHFISNYWFVMLIICFISPIFNGGWILIIIVMALIIYSIYRTFINDDKYNSDSW